MKKTIATMCLMSLLTITMPVQALTVKDGVDITIMPNTVTTTKDLRDYNRFVEVLDEFKKFYNLEDYSVKQLDMYLWQLGKEYFPRY